MRSSTAIVWFLPLLALAQDTPTTSAEAPGETHVVKVGEGGDLFVPDSVQAAPGDVIAFHFFPDPEGHAVGQSTFEAPCTVQEGGLYSGFQPGAEDGGDTAFVVPINNTDPLWLYCPVEDHCNNGMVLVINPPSNPDQSIDNFKSAAANAQNVGQADAVAGGTYQSSTEGSSQSDTPSGTEPSESGEEPSPTAGSSDESGGAGNGASTLLQGQSIAAVVAAVVAAAVLGARGLV